MTVRMNWTTVLTTALVGLLTGLVHGEETTSDPAAVEFFEKKIRPLFVEHCYTCHSADTKAASGLRVDDRNGLLAGGGRGPAVTPGDPGQSVLLKAVRKQGDLKMPPDSDLSSEQIADLERWIAAGAVWPTLALPTDLGASSEEYAQLRNEHWAWQPLTPPTVPVVKNTDWPRDDVDRFLLSKLEERGLAPVGDADKLTLLRRVTFDLTGLPPTLAEAEEFLADESPKAFETVVDRLLQSPAFGERWGRHWLDVARYAESTGSSRNLPYPQAWRYRDYVIDSFNADKPFNQFVQEQIAGDLMPAKTVPEKIEQTVATGFLALGVKDVNQRFKVRFIMDNIDEQIDTVSRSVLGLTASCARCHDHKFDPIPTRDYYALAGIFHSTDLCAGLRNQMGGGGLAYYDTSLVLPISAPRKPSPDVTEKIKTAEAAVEKAFAEFDRLRQSPEGNEKAKNGRPKRQVARQRWNRAKQELIALTDPAVAGDVALGVRDAAHPADTEVRIRGEAEQLGPVVPRGFLEAVSFSGQPQVNPASSGRLELAQWLTHDNNPLTRRVIVNRIWLHLFGKGLVKTVDNFGVTGDKPSHPELLDHLAVRFGDGGWSHKALIRSLVLSRAYQLDSTAVTANLEVDPEDRLQWRHAPRRLDAEEIRDGVLAVAGQLDRSRPVGSLADDLKVVELRNNGPEARLLQEKWRGSRSRSVYLPLLRGLAPTSLEVFDFAEQGMVTGARDTTTVAPQSLFLLNDPFIRKESLALAQRLLTSEKDDAGRINEVYRLALGRPATETEIERATTYLSEYEIEAGSVLNVAGAEEPQEIAATTTDSASNEDAGSSYDNQASSKDKPGKKKAKDEVPENPDEADQTDAPVTTEEIVFPDAKTAAWTSFVQAIIGSAEFRYVP